MSRLGGRVLFRYQIKRLPHTMGQPFRFKTIFDLRKQQRELLSGTVAAARARLVRCTGEQTRIAGLRQDLMNELRELNDSACWNIQNVADRQARLADLRQDLAEVDRQVQDAEDSLNMCMTQFMQADQAFRGLERLAEKHAQVERLVVEQQSTAELNEAAMSHWRQADV